MYSVTNFLFLILVPMCFSSCNFHTQYRKAIKKNCNYESVQVFYKGIYQSTLLQKTERKVTSYVFSLLLSEDILPYLLNYSVE